MPKGQVCSGRKEQVGALGLRAGRRWAGPATAKELGSTQGRTLAVRGGVCITRISCTQLQAWQPGEEQNQTGPAAVLAFAQPSLDDRPVSSLLEPPILHPKSRHQHWVPSLAVVRKIRFSRRSV